MIFMLMAWIIFLFYKNTHISFFKQYLMHGFITFVSSGNCFWTRYVCKIIFDSTLILIDKQYYRQCCCIYKAMLSLPVHPLSPNLPLGLNPEMSPHIWHIPDLRVRALVSMQAPAFLKSISRNLSYLRPIPYLFSLSINEILGIGPIYLYCFCEILHCMAIYSRLLIFTCSLLTLIIKGRCALLMIHVLYWINDGCTLCTAGVTGRVSFTPSSLESVTPTVQYSKSQEKLHSLTSSSSARSLEDGEMIIVTLQILSVFNILFNYFFYFHRRFRYAMLLAYQFMLLNGLVVRSFYVFFIVHLWSESSVRL